MELVDWIVFLAVVLMAIVFLCARTPRHWSRENRARRIAGMRLLAQAACAIWSALLIVVRGLFRINGLAGWRPAPFHALTLVAVLMVCACYWSIRAGRLLKPRRIFAAH